MSADVTSLGLRVTDDGALQTIRKVDAGLEKLSQTSNKTSASWQRMWQGAAIVDDALYAVGEAARNAETKTRTFSTNAAFAFSTLASGGTKDITSVLRSLSTLGFAFGAYAGVATLAISAVADIWAESRKKSADEQEKMIADMKRFAADWSATALEIQIKAKEMRLAQLEGMGEEGLSPLRKFGRQALRSFLAPVGQDLASPFADQIQALNNELAALRTQLAGVKRDDAGKAMEEFAKAEELALKATERLNDALQEGLVRTLKLWMDMNGKAQAEAKFWNDLVGFNAPTVAPDNLLSPVFLNDLATSLDISVDKLKKLRDALKDINDEAERKHRALLGGFIGAGVGILNNAGGLGSVLGGAVQGGLSGAAGGPAGIALGAAFALTDGLLNLGDAEKEAAERTRQLRLSLESFVDGEKAALGLMSGLDARIRALNRSYDEQRKAAATLDALESGWGERRHDRVEELNRLEAQRIQQLIEEQEALEELARQEKFSAAIQKIQDRIESFVDTISGLQDFRNSLLLSDARSPADRLAEAQRQYAEIMGIARGDDIDAAQVAAGRLPAAAQALLDAARTMFGSGAGFQDIFRGTLADTQELINRFTDLKTIEELMLDELQRIRSATETTATTVSGRPPEHTPLGGGSGGSGGTGSTTEFVPTTANAVSTAGFNALIAETRENTAAIRELAYRVQTGLAARAN